MRRHVAFYIALSGMCVEFLFEDQFHNDFIICVERFESVYDPLGLRLHRLGLARRSFADRQKPYLILIRDCTKLPTLVPSISDARSNETRASLAIPYGEAPQWYTDRKLSHSTSSFVL